MATPLQSPWELYDAVDDLLALQLAALKRRIVAAAEDRVMSGMLCPAFCSSL